MADIDEVKDLENQLEQVQSELAAAKQRQATNPARQKVLDTIHSQRAITQLVVTAATDLQDQWQTAIETAIPDPHELLLLDEGDALMARRTDVSNANDRYTNLETQLSVAAARIVRWHCDHHDQRRPAHRQRIWQAHLPSNHAVSQELSEEIATRCAFTGGQIRNAALHATLLAMGENVVVGDAQVEAALQREYRKAGAAFPMRARLNGQGQMDHLRRFAAQLE
jgi:hypothetical protein